MDKSGEPKMLKNKEKVKWGPTNRPTGGRTDGLTRWGVEVGHVVGDMLWETC